MARSPPWLGFRSNIGKFEPLTSWVSGAIVQLSGDGVEQVVDIGEFAERLYDELNRPKLKEEGHAGQ